MPSSPGALGALSSLVIALLLVGFNAFFVAAELAIVRVRRTRLHELAGQGVDAAHVTILLVDRLNATLATAQVGVTVASLGVGWLAEDAFAFLLANMLPEAFAEGAPLHVVAASTAFGLVTVMHIVLGEMVPKNVALERAESVALSTARPLWVFGVVLRPGIWALGRLATAVTRLLGY
jgi:CBS domain containing-hemolysin-like protein